MPFIAISRISRCSGPLDWPPETCTGAEPWLWMSSISVCTCRSRRSLPSSSLSTGSTVGESCVCFDGMQDTATALGTSCGTRHCWLALSHTAARPFDVSESWFAVGHTSQPGPAATAADTHLLLSVSSGPEALPMDRCLRVSRLPRALGRGSLLAAVALVPHGPEKICKLWKYA